MCTFNGQAHLAEQLESIAAQTLLPLELIVCDDRSTDKTVAILEEFRQRVPFRVEIVVNAEQLRTTRNFDQAMRLCRGELIALCDQDDLWMPNKLDALVTLMERNPETVTAFSDAAIIDAESRPAGDRLWKRFRFGPKKQALFLSDPVRILLRHDVITGATMIFRRSLLDEFDEVPTGWVHDGWLAWMSALHGSFAMTAETLTLYRSHAAQQLGTGTVAGAQTRPDLHEGNRSFYRRVAGQFDVLRAYVQEEHGIPSERLAQVTAKRDFLLERSVYPEQSLSRALRVLANVEKYRILGRGLRSMMKDLRLS